MDCHDLRVLLALTHRSDAIDPTERAAIQQHLEACADCATLSQTEKAVDAAFASAMRAVPIPSGLEARLRTRLTAVRPRPWPKVAAVAAAVLLLLGGLALWWTTRPLPRVGWDAAVEIVQRKNLDPDQVERWYAERGIEMVSCRQFDHNYLWTFDVVEFRGQRVPKLIFYRDVKGTPVILQVLVLPTKHFDTSELQATTIPFPEQSVEISVQRPESDDGYVYLFVGGQNGLDAFLRHDVN